MEQDRDDRIRRKAYDLWEAEGRLDGRAEAHWYQAQEIIVIEDRAEPLVTLDQSLAPAADTSEAFGGEDELAASRRSKRRRAGA